ncbi:hypothetical protein [Nostoc sp. NMS8]|uniref:hypothetical protein n=1 Tax=Nostoc sp. NMS8 TaxID=2815392 RepID=UPI0025D04AE0|nr:hypothetical protein [Nostoc sp. NMS8]MBN3957506.1 hypothetical protein [Nostoc sp. NMS8]
MPLPDDFSPFEHLQSVIIQQHNHIVKDYFKDMGDDWEPEVATGRGSLRVACTILDEDSALVMAMRHRLLFDVLGYNKAGLMVYYGSKESIEPPVEGHPKIVFYFSQDSASVPSTQDYKADAEYSVRLMGLENTSTNLHSKLVEIATEIRTQFLEAKQGIILTKGNLGVIYKDPAHGFSNGRRILANTEAEAIDIYKRMCNVIDVIFDEEKITVSNPKKPSTTGTVTQTQVIMGKTRKKRAYRRVVNVRFRYAYALIPGEPQPVFLVDTTYRYHPLVKI